MTLIKRPHESHQLIVEIACRIEQFFIATQAGKYGAGFIMRYKIQSIKSRPFS